MRKYFRVFVAAIAVCCLTGCAAKNTSIQAQMFSNQAGEFQFAEAKWECSKEALEESLGISLEEAVSATEEYQSYMVSDVFKWGDMKADFTCEFQNDKLHTISFLLRPEEGKEEMVWEEICNSFLEQYGQTEPTIRTSKPEMTQEVMETETYLWEKQGNHHTALLISKVTAAEDLKYIEIAVYTITK